MEENGELDYTYEDLYQLYRSRRFQEIENWVHSHTGNFLKAWAKTFNLVWYGGSKASFLRELKVELAQSKVIREGL